MARAPAGLPAGIRLGDHLSPGVIAKAFTPAACDYPRAQLSVIEP
jgi:hypothetical protein